MAPGGAINPLAAFGWTPGYGGIPTVPNPIGTAGSAISGNLGNFGGASNLAALTNLFNQQQQQQQLIRGLPNYSAMVNTSSGNILSNLRGQVPQDVLRQLETTAAERGIGTGTAGSPSGNAALLHALGLTSLDLQGRGEQELTGAIARTPQAPLLNPAQFFVSPEQQQQASAAASLYGSAPNPYAAAQAAMQAARAGAGGGYRGLGGGGFGGASAGPMPPSSYVRQPYASDLQTTFASGPNLVDRGLYENAPAWQQWMQGLPGRESQASQDETAYWNQFMQPGQESQASQDETAYWDQMMQPAGGGFGGSEEEFYGGGGE
jgi:hypothetical protein